MVGERLKQYFDAIAFPASKTAGSAASTILSSVLNPFEVSASKSTSSISTGDTANYPTGSGFLQTWGAFGAAKVVMMVDDKSKVTADSVLVQAFVSFDKGATYVQQGSWRMGPMGGTGTYVSVQTIPFAPRMYLTATLSAAQGIAANSGISIDVEFEEYQPESYKTVVQPSWYNTSGVAVGSGGSPDTKAISDSSYTRYSTPISLGQFSRAQRVSVIGYAADRSKITAPAIPNAIWVQTSMDGTHWFNADSVTYAKPLTGTGIWIASEEIKPLPTTSAGISQNYIKEPGTTKQGVLSKYVRLAIGPKYAPGLQTGNGIRFWFIVYY